MTFLLSVITGIGAGFGVSAGVFALVTSLSLLPRMADKTHTGYAMRTYETWVFWGGMFGNSIFSNSMISLFPFAPFTRFP